MRVALVHDYLVDAGGAEGTLLELHRLFPNAPIHTAIYDPRTTLPEFSTCDIRVSPLQRLARSKRYYKYLLPLYPLAFRAMRLNQFDLVISSSSAFAKAVQVGARCLHLCYCYTPPRFVWYWDEYREREGLNGVRAHAVQVLQPYFKWVDAAAARRVNRFVAISENVRQRIRATYGRDAEIVYPPVRLERFVGSQALGDQFLIVSRLNRYKRIDVAIEAFNQLRLPLVIAGNGPDLDRLRTLAGPSVRLLGRVGEDTLRALYSDCRALVLPGEEDLGLTPLEANGSGRPVVALGRGGARETVVPGKTGVLYPEPTVEQLKAAVEELLTMRFDPLVLRGHAEQFASPHFRQGIRRIIGEELGAQALGFVADSSVAAP